MAWPRSRLRLQESTERLPTQGNEVPPTICSLVKPKSVSGLPTDQIKRSTAATKPELMLSLAPAAPVNRTPAAVGIPASPGLHQLVAPSALSTDLSDTSLRATPELQLGTAAGTGGRSTLEALAACVVDTTAGHGEG